MLEFSREVLSMSPEDNFFLHFSLKALLTFLHYFGFPEHCSIEGDTFAKPKLRYNLTLAIPEKNYHRRYNFNIVNNFRSEVPVHRAKSQQREIFGLQIGGSRESRGHVL
jgi:hypothetical protein